MIRRLLPCLAALLILMTGSAAAASQQASPAAADSALAELGYPELQIVVTDEGSDVPEEVTAGRILIALDNQSSGVSDVNVLQLPEGVTLDDLNALMTSESGETPAWFADLDSAGGFNVAPGNTGYGVIDLEAGEWYIGVGDFNPYAPLTVTGDAASPTAQSELPADLNLEMHEFDLGVPDQIGAGPQVWHVANTGEQSHEIQLIKTPELLDVEQVITIMTLPEGGTPPAGIPDPSTFEFIPEGVKTMSAGREIWIEMDLQPGTYVAICANVDAELGQPHALLGEIHTFTAGD